MILKSNFHDSPAIHVILIILMILDKSYDYSHDSQVILMVLDDFQ